MRPAACLLFVLSSLAALPASGKVFHVDPVRGSNQGDGSRESPWRTMQEVVEANLIESQEWSQYPYQEGASLKPKNAGAPVKAGDTVLLYEGHHGELFLQSFYNAATITVAAAEGQRPTLSKVHLRSGSRWHFRGLTVGRELAPVWERSNLVHVENHGYRGPCSDVVIEGFEVFSVRDTSAWTAADWDTRACNGISVAGTNITVRDNRLKNVNFGIAVTATHSLVERNEIANFSGDGLRGLGNHTVFQYNLVKNCYDVNDNHDDGFQSWSVGADGQVGTGEVVGIVLRGNVILNYEDPAQPHRGPLQGIGCFDGMFVDWVVENNVIVTDHWHGLTLMGARNCRIVNNTVVDINAERPGPPWIAIDNHKNGTVSEGNVVRNNLATSFDLVAGTVDDHNIVVKDVLEHFLGYPTDLRLKATSEAVNTGTSDLAPTVDALGIPRPQGTAVDVGAYEHPEGLADCAALGGTCCGFGQVCADGSSQPAADCGMQCCVGGICRLPNAVCGDGTCSESETCLQCPADCGVCCGNGKLDEGEHCDDSVESARCPGNCDADPCKRLRLVGSGADCSARCEPDPEAPECSTTAPEGCGCQSASAGPLASAVWLALWWSRRRSRRCTPRGGR